MNDDDISKKVETNIDTLMKREKSIQYGKNTDEYKRYNELIEKYSKNNICNEIDKKNLFDFLEKNANLFTQEHQISSVNVVDVSLMV